MFGFRKGKTSVRGFLFIGLLILTVVVTACSNKKASSETGSQMPSATVSPSESAAVAVDKVVQDGMGHEVAIPANPER
ncbi:MAG: hypothetical protein H7X86_00640, partial [Gorillibacterium sp.]|nr:hypothetical protein [Gorillibacterium sp.]